MVMCSECMTKIAHEYSNTVKGQLKDTDTVYCEKCKEKIVSLMWVFSPLRMDIKFIRETVDDNSRFQMISFGFQTLLLIGIIALLLTMITQMEGIL